MTDEHRDWDANWTKFPFAHPTPFTLILLEMSPQDLLACRATCTTWCSWFSNSSTIWSKYYTKLRSSLPKYISYRLGKLLAVPVQGESAAFSMSLKLFRALREDQGAMNQGTMDLVSKLEKKVPVLAPPYIFIKLKVNHPVVTKIAREILDRFLSCILVNKTDVDTKNEVRMLILRNMMQHQFAFIDFEKPKPDQSVDTSDSLVLSGEDKLEEALRLSLEPSCEEVSGEKRKMSESGGGNAKRIKLDDEKGEDEVIEEIDDEDEVIDDPESIYDSRPTPASNPGFPTLLELLSIDQPLVEELLVTKCQIDSSLIVPQFDEFLHHPALLASAELLVGCDQEGKVASVRPSSFSQETGGVVLGSIEAPMSLRRGVEIQFWGGKDIRQRWPQFANQLDNLDKAADSRQGKVKDKMALPVVATLPTEKKQGEKESGDGAMASSSSSSSSSVSDMMARLAARGVFAHKK